MDLILKSLKSTTFINKVMWILSHYGFSSMENRFLMKNRKSWFLRNFHNARTRIWMRSSTVGGWTSHGNFQRAISTCREQLSLFHVSNLSIKQFQMMFMCNSRYFVAQGKNGTERLASKSRFSISTQRQQASGSVFSLMLSLLIFNILPEAICLGGYFEWIHLQHN